MGITSLLLFSLIMLLLIVLVFWGFRRSRAMNESTSWIETLSDLQLGLLLLAAFAIGVFLAYFLPIL